MAQLNHGIHAAVKKKRGGSLSTAKECWPGCVAASEVQNTAK